MFSQAAGVRPNSHVFSALIGRAAKRLDYVYLKTILKTMKSMEVWPSELIIQQLEFAAQYPLSYNQVGLFLKQNLIGNSEGLNEPQLHQADSATTC